MNNEGVRELATKRLKAKSDFYHYLLVWLGVSLLVTVIWFISNPGGYFWPGWVIGGMGIAAFFQAVSIYGPTRGLTTESAIDAEVNRITKGSPPAQG